MTFPETPADWSDVSFGITSGFVEGYQRGHRDGHRAGFEQGIQVASARDDQFVRSLADEIRRRDLDDDKDTTGVRQWIKNLIDSLDAKARRDAFGQRVRQDREQRQTNPQTQPRRAA